MMSSRDWVRIVGAPLGVAAVMGGVWVSSADARTGTPVGGPSPAVSAPAGAVQLHELAAALDEQGRGAHSGTFTGLAFQKGRVHLWATSLPAARAIIADARRSHPELDMTLVVSAVGRYSRSQLDARARLLMGSATARRLGVQSAAPRVDGSGLEVTLLARQPATNPATILPATLATLARLAGVPVTGTIRGAITAA